MYNFQNFKTKCSFSKREVRDPAQVEPHQNELPLGRVPGEREAQEEGEAPLEDDNSPFSAAQFSIHIAHVFYIHCLQ